MQQTDLDNGNGDLIININKDHILPEGKYKFIEFYCTDPQCDCNSGAFQMVQLDSQGKETQESLALMDYNWSLPIAKDNPILGPEFSGNRIAVAGLGEFKRLLIDDGDTLRKIILAYANTREDFSAQDHKEPPQAAINKNADKVGRNDPCPCGSGKKYKKCCL